MTQAADETPAGANPKDAKSVLEALAVTLGDRPNGDLDLTGVLVSHVLTATPAKKAVEEATTAILALAEARAKASVEKDAAHG